MEDEDTLRDSCAVFGCVTQPESRENVNLPNIMYLGLMALQHRQVKIILKIYAITLPNQIKKTKEVPFMYPKLIFLCY